MAENLLERALASASETRAMLVGHGVVNQIATLISDTFGSDQALLVADENTWDAAGKQVKQLLAVGGVTVGGELIFPATPSVYAGYENVEKVRDWLALSPGVPIAIGSGTINDLVKLAAGELKREYAVVATAASMDGYAAYGASITKEGFKITRVCPAPAAIVADIDILSGAPARLTATGVGDLIEKIPAGADWILADELGIEEIDPHVWQLVQDPLRASLADPQGLARSEPGAIEHLGQGLLMSGLSMQAHRSSRPASGAGHQFSHLWEMEGLGQDWRPPLAHGAKVGLGTIAVTALYEVLLDRGFEVDIDEAVAAWPTWEEVEDQLVAARLPERGMSEFRSHMRKKYIDRHALAARLETAKEQWPTIAQRLRDQLIPAKEIESTLATVGALTHPSAIGVDEASFNAMYSRARMIRLRYTVLDFLYEANLLGRYVDVLFAPGGFWASRPWPKQ